MGRTGTGVYHGILDSLRSFYTKCDLNHVRMPAALITILSRYPPSLRKRHSLRSIGHNGLRSRSGYRVLMIYNAVLCVLVSGAGCGHYSTSTRALPAHIRTIAIPLFQNATVETGIKEQLTDTITSRFVSDNQLKVVDARDADSIITGTIVDVRDESLSFVQGENTRETRIWIFAHVRYEDVRQRKVLWEEQRMQAWGVFDVNTGSSEERQQGIDQAIAKLADDILNKTIAGW